MTSAFWHGFYPCYYIAFTLAVFISFVHKDIYAMWIYFRWIPKPIRMVICCLAN